MKTIHIDVKDPYVQNVLAVLESLKGIMLNRIDIEPAKKSEKKSNPESIMTLQETSMKSTWDNEADEVWDAL
jgi:hypothetical protein